MSWLHPRWPAIQRRLYGRHLFWVAGDPVSTTHPQVTVDWISITDHYISPASCRPHCQDNQLDTGMIQESYPPNLENDAFGLLCQRARCVPLRVIIAEIRLACHPAAEAAGIEQEAKMRSMEAALTPDLRDQRDASPTPLRGLRISVTSCERW